MTVMPDPNDWDAFRDWVVNEPLAAADELTRLHNEIVRLRGPRYLLVEIGCIECREPAHHCGVTTTIPEGLVPVADGGSIEVTYATCRVAFEVVVE